MSKKIKEAWQVLSPDKITIELEHPTYPSEAKAKAALKKWIKRYEFQGYYSFRMQRIPLTKLADMCTIKQIQ